MTIGILITARLGSARLQRKHLRPIAGKPGLHYLTERIQRQFLDSVDDRAPELLVATSTAEENRAFRDAVPAARVFFGDNEHIPRRHLQAAWTFGLDAIVSVDGDDLLCSPAAIRAVHDELARGRVERVSTTGLPLGMNAWGYTTDALACALEGNTDRRCDTGWGRVFDDIVEESVVELGSLAGTETPAGGDPELRLTLDYDEDLAFFRAVIERLGSTVYTATDAEIIELICAEELHALNASVIDAYWTSFRAEKAEQVASASSVSPVQGNISRQYPHA